MSNIWLRNIQIITGGRKFNYPDLDITFTTNFDSDTVPDESDISIYNLTDSTIANIKKGQQITLAAGYGRDVGTILDGVISDATLVKNDTDRELQIKALNVTSDYLNHTINYTYGKGSGSEHIIRDVLGYIGIIPNEVSLHNPITYYHGFAANGKIKDVVNRLARDAGGKVIIRNSSITIVDNNSKGDWDTAWLLNSKTGLIDISPIDDTNTIAKYKITTFLNHAIAPYTVLKIQSLTFNGMALVIDGSHKADDSNFETEANILPL